MTRIILTKRNIHALQDLGRELRKISSFLEIERSVQLYEAIARECSINRMREVDAALKDQFPVNISKTGKNFIYRKGEGKSLPLLLLIKTDG